MEASSFEHMHTDRASDADPPSVKALNIKTIEPHGWSRDVSTHNAANTNFVFDLPPGDYTRADSFRINGRIKITGVLDKIFDATLPFIQPKYHDMWSRVTFKLGDVSETESEPGLVHWFNMATMSSDYANSTLSNAGFWCPHGIGATPSTYSNSSLTFPEVVKADTVGFAQFSSPPPMWIFWSSGDTFRIPQGSQLVFQLGADVMLATVGFGVAPATGDFTSVVLDELYLTYEDIQPTAEICATIESGAPRYLNYLNATITDSGSYTAASMDFSMSIGRTPSLIFYLWMLTSEDKAYADKAALLAAKATARVPLGLTSVKPLRIETYINGNQVAPDLSVQTLNSYVDTMQAWTELVDAFAAGEVVQDHSGGNLWSYKRQRESFLVGKRVMPRDPARGGEFESTAFNNVQCVVRSKITHTTTITAAHCYRIEVAPRQIEFSGPLDVARSTY